MDKPSYGNCDCQDVAVDEKQRTDRIYKLRSELAQVEIGLNGNEMCSFLRVMGMVYSAGGMVKPTEDDLVAMESYIKKYNEEEARFAAMRASILDRIDAAESASGGKDKTGS